MIGFERVLRAMTLIGGIVAVSGLALLSGWSAQQMENGKPKYMEPRFPSYLKPVKSTSELMPQARALVRNKSALQGLGLGIVKQGETIGLVYSIEAEDMALQAIQQALKERGVKAVLLPEYEFAGVTKQDALDLQKALPDHTAEDGEETAGWIEGTFPDPDGVKKWLKAQRPDLYAQIFPPQTELSAHLKEVRDKFRGPVVGKALGAYLEKHPEMSGIYWGKGGSSYLRRYLHPHEEKLLGLFLWDNQWDVMSEMSNFPADVWQLLETQTLDPLAYIDKIRVFDPEGTDVQADLSQDQAERFERGVYHRGHMFMNPNQAYGRFGYSVVDYPGFQKDWLSPDPEVIFNGMIAATNGHGGFFPRMEVHITNGDVTDIRGGGLYGDLFRTFLKYPHINDTAYPFYKRPGFFKVYEFALGTNPKGFRHPNEMLHGSGGHLVPERNRSGVFHLAYGVFVQHGPDSLEMPKEWIDFTKKYNLPIDHSFHMHNYFATYQVHLRNANRSINLVDKGHLTSLDSPEVRALASRYGDPTTILSEDWVPDVPGINAAGSYDDYAKNPWVVSKAQLDKILAGTYAHYFPPAGSKNASKGAATARP
jgi:hypothetical protein